MPSTPAPGNIWEVMTGIHDQAESLYETLVTFDWDKFLPVVSEEAMEG